MWPTIYLNFIKWNSLIRKEIKVHSPPKSFLITTCCSELSAGCCRMWDIPNTAGWRAVTGVQLWTQFHKWPSCFEGKHLSYLLCLDADTFNPKWDVWCPPTTTPPLEPLFTVAQGDRHHGNIPLQFIPAPITWETSKSQTKKWNGKTGKCHSIPFGRICNLEDMESLEILLFTQRVEMRYSHV